MSTGRPSPSTSFAAASLRVFDLSLGEMLWSRRSVFLAVLVAAPVMVALAVRLILAWPGAADIRVNGAPVSGGVIFGLIIWLLYIRFIVPVLGAFYGTSLIADEVDDKTITYLFTRPIPRSSIVVGKFLAYLVCTVLLVLPSVVIVYFALAPLAGGVGASFPALVEDLAMLAIGLTAYGALFAWVGARIKRPLVVGLAFAFGWEPVVLLFPGYLKRLTVAYYLQGLVPHAMPQDSAVSLLLQVFREVPPMTVSLSALAVISAVALASAALTAAAREYVLEQ